MIRTLATVFLLLLAAALAHADGLEQTHQTVPSANSSFLTDLQNFLKKEDASRHADLYPSSVVSGGTHTTEAGLVGTPDSMVAYVGGYYVTEDASITYPDASTCWVIAHKTMTGNQGSFTRVSGSHYLINCSTTAQPALPDSTSVYLMKVTTSGGAITAVEDLRPFGGEVGFNLCKYASLDAALTALGQRPAHLILNCALPVIANQSIPITASLWPSRSGYFDVASSATITMVKPEQIPSSARWQIFRGASTTPVTFTNSGIINPEWWGAGTATSAANNTTYLNRAIDSQPTNSYTTIVSLSYGTYQHDNSILTNSRNVCLIGQGRHSTSLELTTVASNRHGFKVTGTTQYQCVKGVGFFTSSPLTVDNTQTAIRMDAVNDAPNLTADAEQYIEDVKYVGYNIGGYADGGSTFLIARRTATNWYASSGGSGLSSGVNEGDVCQRVTHCVLDNFFVDGNDIADHGSYNLGVLSLSVTRGYITGTLNGAIKIIPTFGVSGLTDPYHWTASNNTIVACGMAIEVTVDQDYILDRVDLSNNTIHTISSTGSSDSAIYVQAAGTAIIRNLDVRGLSATAIQESVLRFDASDTAVIQHVNATDQVYFDWSIGTDDTYSAISPQEFNSGQLLSLTYSGSFNGNSHGRSIFPPATRDLFPAGIQALGVYETGTAVPEGHPIISRMGTSTEYLKAAGNIYCNTTADATDANTTETDFASKTLAASALDSSVSGVSNTSGIRVRAWGTFANTATVKTVRLYIAGDVVKSNSVTTSPQNVDWVIEAYYHRVSGTQQAGYATMLVGTASQGVSLITDTYTLSNSLIVKVSGQNGTANANDIHFRGLCIDGLPN